jgi:hypothetical protein
MKTNYKITVLAALVAAFAGINAANAQSNPAAGNTTAASPKVQAQLDDRKATLNTARETARHLCSDCTDTIVTSVDKATKGGKQLVSNVIRHACAACDTRIVTTGVGKAKQDVAIHSCKSEAKPLCCAKN